MTSTSLFVVCGAENRGDFISVFISVKLKFYYLPGFHGFELTGIKIEDLLSLHFETNLRPENRKPIFGSDPIFDCCFWDQPIIDLFSGERTKIGLFYVRAFSGP